MANYSANPTGPKPEPQSYEMGQGGAMEPRSIRDYLSIAKEGARRFTNIQGEAGEGTLYMPEQQDPQAIPEGPQSAYEQMPFSQRVQLSPYIRAKERVKTMMPELWETMFPGMQQGATLEPHQMKQWEGAVGSLTSNLLKHFDKQYGEALKLKSKGKDQRFKDQQYWQQFYNKEKSMGRPVIDPEGMPVSEADFVRERMSVSDEIRIKDALKDKPAAATVATEQYDVKQIGEILGRNPELKRQILFQIKGYLEQTLGALNEKQFNDALTNPRYQQIRSEAIHDTLKQYNDEIIKAAGQPQE